MSSDLKDAIRNMVEEKGISEDLVLSTIEDILKAAYKRKFGTDENAVVMFNDDHTDVQLCARRVIVDEDHYYNEVTEIPLEEARELSDEAEIGDELLVGIDLQNFDRISVQSAKQRAHQNFRDIQKDTLYSEFKAKEGEMIIGYYQREQNGDIFVDLGNTEGILPKRFQSAREIYRKNDKIKCYVQSVEKAERGVRVILSRTHTEFVRKLFEVEVPEIYDHTVEIYKIVREAGYRTKVAVYTHHDIDPVGACVGLRGVRIQTIMRELEGEKIDILKYDPNPAAFIANALSPAQVRQVVITDEHKRTALALVDENQLSLAIGKQGLNVRLANKLADWLIDVKTMEQFGDMDIASGARELADSLFYEDQDGGSYGEVLEGDDMDLASYPLDAEVVAKLQQGGVFTIEDFFNLSDEELLAIDGITEEEIAQVQSILEQHVDIVEEQVDDDSEEFEFACPECGHPVTPDMAVCPNCNVGLQFEEVEEEEEE